jgi:hypothetical protein
MMVGDWFAFHGGAIPTSQAKLRSVIGEAESLRRIVRPEDTSLISWKTFCPTGIVAVARYTGHVTESPSFWFSGPIGWTWSRLVVLPQPIPCKGAQGLWRIPDGILDEIRIQFKAGHTRKADVSS